MNDATSALLTSSVEMEAGNGDHFRGPPGQEAVIPENDSPPIVSSSYLLVTGFLEHYGWYTLLTVIVIYYLYTKLSSHIHRTKSAWNQSNDYSQYDSEAVFRRQEAMDAARRRLQEQHEAMVQKYKEEQIKKEEEKRKKKIEEWNNHLQGKGYRSKVKVEEPQSGPATLGKKKTVYRTSDYSPLAGGSGGTGFRPSRRNASRGG